MRDGSKTKTKIEAVALKLFVEKGVAETTIRDLAQAAGIAEGTLYRHYASKEAMIWDLFSTNYAAFAHRLTVAQAPHTLFDHKLAAIVDEFCRFFDAEPVLFRFLLVVQHQTLPHIANDADNPVEVIQHVIADALAQKEIVAPSAGLATTIVLGLLLQPAIGIVYGRVEPPFSTHAQTITQACLRALRP